jgi:hypothetical protein
MTVVSNVQGCGSMAVSGWLTELVITGKSWEEDIHDALDPIEDIGKDFREGVEEVGGGIQDILDKPLWEPKTYDDLRIAAAGGGSIIAGGLNKALDSLPTTLGEAGAKDVLTGAKSGGDALKDIAIDAGDAMLGGVAEGIEKGVGEALGSAWDVGARAGLKDWTKVYAELTLRYDWEVCDPWDLEIGGEQFTWRNTLYVRVGAGYNWYEHWYADAAAGAQSELFHNDSGVGGYAGYEQNADGTTTATGGLSYSFGKRK